MTGKSRKYLALKWKKELPTPLLNSVFKFIKKVDPKIKMMNIMIDKANENAASRG